MPTPPSPLAHDERAFIERMGHIFLAAMPAAADVVLGEHFARTVAEQARKAAAYGLHSARDASFFVVGTWLLGTGFDERMPEVQAALTDPARDSAQKAAFLESFTIALHDRLARRLDEAAACDACPS